jgi:hypothetical protein
MTMGTDWDELSVPYSDPTNSEIAMDMAPDRYRFVLKRTGRDGAGSALDLQRRRDCIIGADHCERHWQAVT